MKQKGTFDRRKHQQTVLEAYDNSSRIREGASDGASDSVVLERGGGEGGDVGHRIVGSGAASRIGKTSVARVGDDASRRHSIAR